MFVCNFCVFFPTCLFEILIMSDPRLHLTKGGETICMAFWGSFFLLRVESVVNTHQADHTEKHLHALLWKKKKKKNSVSENKNIFTVNQFLHFTHTQTSVPWISRYSTLWRLKLTGNCCWRWGIFFKDNVDVTKRPDLRTLSNIRVMYTLTCKMVFRYIYTQVS